MKRLTVLALLGATFFASPAYAVPVPTDAPRYDSERRMQAPDVLSGGIGTESRALLDSLAGDYNTKLVFTGEGGMYLSDVGVTVTDNSGNIVFSRETDGPVLLTSLPEGQYTVTAEAEGHLKKQKLWVNNKNRINTQHLRFPVTDQDAVATLR